MRHTIKFAALLGFLVALAASPPSADAQETCAKADTAAVAPTLQRFLTALANADDAALKAVLAPDFLAFDSGRRYAGMALPTMIANLRKSGTQVRLSMSDAQVHARCGLAWVTYLNSGTLTTGAVVKTPSWLESAILEWDGAAWRVKFMQATPVAAQ